MTRRVPMAGADSPEVWREAARSRTKGHKVKELMQRLLDVPPPRPDFWKQFERKEGDDAPKEDH